MSYQITPQPTARAQGALLGLAVGDALGTTLEFTGPLDPSGGPRVGTTGL